MKYRVLAECTTYYYLDVEADNKDEALEKAEETDGGEFCWDTDGSWYITDALPINEQ